MSSSLANRLEDIPGVESVVVDLTEEGGGINIRLRPGADETEVMERLRTLLIAYGVRSAKPDMAVEEQRPAMPLGVKVRITPLEHGARVEVETKSVKSFRVVAANPHAIAQGLSDAWSQVIARVPVEIVGVGISDDGRLRVVASDGVSDAIGHAEIDQGWESALTLAVGRALGVVPEAVFANGSNGQ